MAGNNGGWQDEFFGHLLAAVSVIVRAAVEEQTAEITLQPAALTAKQAATYLGIGETKFRELVKGKEIPAPIEIGGRPHWRRKWLDRYLDRLDKR